MKYLIYYERNGRNNTVQADNIKELITILEQCDDCTKIIIFTIQ